ncbi:MAG: cation:proton antiporter [Sulfitobacter sp.]|nr:cation:proton antiporter [Sulfitobacter sp.]
MDISHLLITLGLLFLTGLAADQLGRFTHLPRVTMLLLLGLIAGDAGFGLFNAEVISWFDTVAIVALTMVAFLLGSSLSRSNLAAHGRAILAISLSVVVVTVLLVALGLIAAGLEPGIAFLLGAIATATAPAAIADVIRQTGLTNRFTEMLKGIVAIDDAWGLLAFSLTLAMVSSTGGGHLLNGAAIEIGGAILLGGMVGLPAAYLTGRIAAGEPLQAEAIGIVFLTAGLALWLNVSFLIAGMTAGALIANVAPHHDRAFHEIEHVQWPFLILFFLLAGASLEFDRIWQVGTLSVVFICLRIVSRLVGGWIGAALVRAPREERMWYGPALLPQAGVAVGMALVAGEALPEWSSAIMALTLSATVIFELIGPPITFYCIRRVTQRSGL